MRALSAADHPLRSVNAEPSTHNNVKCRVASTQCQCCHCTLFTQFISSFVESIYISYMILGNISQNILLMNPLSEIDVSSRCSAALLNTLLYKFAYIRWVFVNRK